ncbi:fibroblast growth factor 4A [Lepisosteus oculatus]|uniref:fibroblast growth factor 4A n=1 Tax=Lepisosteus oculatus TaxID=7918 RepID=UPI00073FEC40|nr:PREDICTED: fibroblast growth factor 4A-like isoform X2 [Lepisosteus oculatus]
MAVRVYPWLVLLAACVTTQWAERLSNTSLDERGSQIRRLWQLSIKELKGKSRGILPSFSLAGVMRRQLLYCPIGIGYHLQILANGSVWGVHKHTDYCWVRLFAVSPGVVGILGLKSGLYLSMNKEGDLHGSGNFTEDCLFKEILEESYYNTYASHRYPGFYVGLTKQGKAKRGNKAQRHWHSTQFLPRLVHVESHT